MACLYTKLIKNPKYLPNKKNKGKPPECTDERTRYVPVSCGRCYECRKQKKREWMIRLSEEIKTNKAIFVTLTISNKSFKELREKNESENDICTKAVRRYLERIRSKTKKSIKHWFITELGEEKGRIHLHGLIFTENKELTNEWKYGHVFIGQFVNERTINYITKYMLKENPQNKNFVGKVLCSAGIGKGYIDNPYTYRNRYQENNKTIQTYKFRNGKEIYLPTYYRYKLYNEEEREKLWIEAQERGYRYICGVKIDTSIENEKNYHQALMYFRERNEKLHNDIEQNWEYEKERRRRERLNRYLKKHRS